MGCPLQGFQNPLPILVIPLNSAQLVWYLVLVNSYMVWFTSAVTSVGSSQMEHCIATHPFHIPWSVNQRFSHFALKFVQSQDYWTIQPQIYHCRFYGTHFETFSEHLVEFLEVLTSSVLRCMMTLHTGDVLMQQKMAPFCEQSRDATSSCYNPS